MDLQWEEGFTISVDTGENTVVVRANREGLLSCKPFGFSGGGSPRESYPP